MINLNSLTRFRQGQRILDKLLSPQEIQGYVNARKQIWHCATPKSASTYLTLVLRILWQDDCCTGGPVPYWHDRFQEPDLLTLFHRIKASDKPYYSGHLHQRFTTFTHSYFLQAAATSGGGVIVQTRGLLDTIVSLKEHIDRDRLDGRKESGPWFVTVDALWQRLSEEEKYALISRCYAYWHVDFLRSWQKFGHRVDVTYEDVTESPTATISEICRYFHIPKSDDQIHQALALVNTYSSGKKRLNVGRSGRGKELVPSALQDELTEFVARCTGENMAVYE
jgi:hypothetical protein